MMPRIPDDPNDSWALTALTELGRDSVQRPTKAELDQGFQALHSRIAAERSRGARLVRRPVVALAAAIVTLSVVLVASVFLRRWIGPRPVALAYQVEGGSVLEGGYLRESGRAGITLRFNEGSRFVLRPGSRGRVRQVDGEGARVAVDNGTASVEIRPGSGRRWVVEAGPFLVTVTGTVFTVSWDPSIEEFQLRLDRGRVVVSGPVTGGELALQTGQRLVVSLAKGETLITENRATLPTDDAVEAVPAAIAPSGVPHPSAAQQTSAAPVSAITPAPPAASEAKAGRRWAEALANGHWDLILEDVERDGVDATLSRASSEELSALANAARYRRRTELARTALLALRRRFPSSPRALDAAFLLGRVEESRPSGLERAVAWYDEYLVRAPSGAYAAEALGRKMTVITRSGDPQRARWIAEEYLRRFPKGSYAGAARALLERTDRDIGLSGK